MSKLNALLEVNEIFINIMKMVINPDQYEFKTEFSTWFNSYEIWIMVSGIKTPSLIFEFNGYRSLRSDNPYTLRWYTINISEPENEKSFRSKQEAMKELIEWIKVFPSQPE